MFKQSSAVLEFGGRGGCLTENDSFCAYSYINANVDRGHVDFVG